MGESKYWTPPQFPDPVQPIGHGFMIIGGELEDCSAIADIFMPRLGPATRYRFMSSTEAELVKYFENSYFALKVTFANEIRRICEAMNVNYHVVREGWLDDPRVGPMHTAAFKQAPGYGGKCYPKDIAALASACRTIGIDPVLLDAVIKVNNLV
jgi:UDP-glucose 6-dehydrogenase